MIAMLALQVLVGGLTSLILSLLFGLGAWRHARFRAGKAESSSIANWIVAHRRTVMGFTFGVAMYMVMDVTPAIAGLVDGKGLRIEDLLFGIPVWTLAGLFVGWPMSFRMRKRQKATSTGGDPGAKI